MGRLPSVLAARTSGDRRGLRHRPGPRSPDGRLLRRGHLVDGRRGRTPGAPGRRRARSRESVSSPRRPPPTSTRPTPPPCTPASGCPPERVPTICAARCARVGPRCNWPHWPGTGLRPRRARRPAHRTSRESPTRARGVTERWRSCSPPTGEWPNCSVMPPTTDEFLERWRVPGETGSRQWEDRFGEEALLPLARSAFDRALARAGTACRRHRPSDRDRSARPGGRSPEEGPGCPGRAGGAGPGRAHRQSRGRPGRGALADVLERATAGQVVAMVEVADGADVVVLRPPTR